MCISVITYAELEYGIRNSNDPEKNRLAINQILAGIRILDFDLKASILFSDILANLRKKNIINQGQDRDKMIAAHARSRGNVLVTDNTKDFIDIENLRLTTWRVPGDLNH